MPFTLADVALGAFTACNTARVFAYLPQIVKISRDTQGAAAISYATWALFGVSHLSTVAYAIVVVTDWRMAAVFIANTLCCVIILGLTAWKRALFKATQKALGSAEISIGRTNVGGAAVEGSDLAASAMSMKPAHRHSLRVVGEQNAAR